jgi:hypothetical protein
VDRCGAGSANRSAAIDVANPGGTGTVYRPTNSVFQTAPGESALPEPAPGTVEFLRGKDASNKEIEQARLACSCTQCSAPS